MSALAEATLTNALDDARSARSRSEAAQKDERHAVVTYIDTALASGWTWERIGEALGITGTGARRYYNRNRRGVRNG